MQTFALFLLRRRRWVIGFWLVVLLAGGTAAGRLPDRLSSDFSLPGQEGSETQAELARTYGVSADLGCLPVLTAPAGRTIARADVTAVADRIRAMGGVQVLDYGGTGDPDFLTEDGHSTFLLVYGPQPAGFDDPLADPVDRTVRAAARERGLTAAVTGYNQLAAGSDTGGDKGLSVLGETLVGALGALLVLVFVFASFLALVPLLIAGVSILATFLVVLGLTTFTDVSFVVQFLIALVGLGVAIDYSLLVVSRWREERARGRSNDEAVVTAVTTAGRAVLASGITVAISLVALVVVDVPLIRSMGFGGMVIPVISTLVVLTLLPVLLSVAGPRVDRPRLRTEGHTSRAWSAWARGVVRYRWAAAGVACAALALAIVPVFGLQIGQSGSDSLARDGVAHDTLAALRTGGVGDGVLTPMPLLVRSGADATAVATAAGRVDGVRMAVVAPAARGGVTEVVVVPEHETVDNTSVAVVSAVRNATRGLPGYIGVAGRGAVVLDYQRAVFDNFPYVLGLIALVTFVLLVRTFRSLLLPLKAVLLNLVSVAAVFGSVTWFWQDGHGSGALFGIAATGALTFWLPVLIFAFLFGLSMDYEVFILARMREEYDRTGSTSYAVEHGLGRTGRLVTSAALILFFAFAALAAAPGTDIKVLATALGAGILLDATVVRALLVPAMVSLFGKYNWWLPAGIARLLRVEASPLTPDTVVPAGHDAGSHPQVDDSAVADTGADALTGDDRGEVRDGSAPVR
ncbi:MMPL family transporter [Streptomyces fagopyri]|uniref:MMPL family transporter n=1 Tax=Streptomyces fagopyri TaxID=2662397 RepID=A0A5Q0L685_9ACTN|nr:MMPL family transporter [Streptomyces fagopyri]QFZ72451.1 MMPL family transporter [Streptomyces fagopyri]